MSKKRNIYLDVLKAIDIILVVLGHCIQYGSGKEYYAAKLFFENPIFKFIYSFHMPLFMLISGYLFAYSFKSKKWNELLFVKFKQLIIPLGCWSVVSLAISIGKLAASASLQSINVIWIAKELLNGFVYGPWFLWAVWWCSFVIIFVKRFFKDNWVVYLLGTLLTFVIPDRLNFSLYKFMWPFFLLAYLFNTYGYQEKLKKIYLNKIFIPCVFVGFGALLFFYNYDTFIYTSGHCVLGKNVVLQILIDCQRFATGLLGSLSVMYLVFVIVKIMPEKPKNLVGYIGQNTLGIYILSDILIVNVLAVAVASLNGINWLYILAETVIILALTLLINAILKRIKITNKLFLGGR